MKLRFPVACVLLFTIAGCSEDASINRVALNGSATMSDKPVAKGFITLTPKSGTEGPLVSFKVTDGVFSVAAEAGPAPGIYTAKINTGFEENPEEAEDATPTGRGGPLQDAPGGAAGRLRPKTKSVDVEIPDTDMAEITISF